MTIKRVVFAFFVLNIVFLNVSFSQKYDAIDNIVLKYSKFDTAQSLAERIEKDFTTDYDKARAIYTWVALNIKYDYAAMLKPQRTIGFSYSNEAEKQRKIRQINDQLVQKTFTSRKAVCEGFTALYQHLAELTGLKSEIIRGDSKTTLSDIGRKNTTSNHAWNMVLIDKKWRLVDVTWGQGYYDSNKGKMINDYSSVYFDTAPDYFFAKHFPDSGFFLGEKLSKEDFLNRPLIYNKTIEKEYEILEPNSGIIEVKYDDKIKFKFKNISNPENLFYLNKKNQPVKIENPKERKGNLEFEVTFDKNIGNFITFYLGQNSIASFKILPK